MNFVIRDKLDSTYATTKHLDRWDQDINKAFTFRRKCDASQMLTLTKKEKSSYDIVKCTLDTLKETSVGANYKVTEARKGIPGGAWVDVIYKTKEEAEAAKEELAKHYRVHPDYISVKETYEQVNAKKTFRPSWDDYLLGLAFVVAQRSHDSQSQHGCVITDKDHRILGTGYNGFARGLDDTVLPTVRPAKYDWIIHSEMNALSNCIIKPEGGVAYITGEPCCPCLMQLYQSGIRKIRCGAKYCWQKNNKESREVFDKFIKMSNIELVYAEPNLEWLAKLGEHINEFRTRPIPEKDS